MIQIGNNNNICLVIRGQQGEVQKPARFSITGMDYSLYFNLDIFMYVN